jgi:hypothetical protein
MLRGCAGRVSVAHVREQRKFNREQEDLEVRGGVRLANQFDSIVSSHDPRHPATSTLRHRRAHLIVPILFTAGIYFPLVLLHNQGYPKVCPNSLNLLNAGDSLPEYCR